MAISITPSPFGSVTVTLDGELGGVLSVGVLATSNSALNMDLGVPGPTGATGATGAAGTNGTNGIGVPTGGSAGQVLAKIDGTDYNTEWVDGGAGGDYLPLAGGTMTGDITFSVDGNGNDSLLGPWGFGVENTSGQVAYIQPDVFRIYDNDHLTGTSLNGEGITFNDSTVQTTAGLPLTGGTMSGAIQFSPNNDGWYSTLGSGGFLFAGDGNAKINIEPANFCITDTSGNGFYFTKNEITFPDNTLQFTAFPPAGGTTSQYIDGTGALQTFPTVTTAGKMVTSVRNNSGATITKGTVVYINGAVGNKPTIAKAQANSEATSKATYGFVEANIANNADGNIVILGLLENIDTQGFSDGDLLYLSPTTAGGWTKTQPFSPYHYVRVGTVIRGEHPTLGSIAVQVTNGFQLDEMSDVGAVSPTNNNVLTWVSASSQWLDRSISTILGYTPANGTDYLAKADNLSGLASTSTARTNLGLGAVSTDAYATTAQAQAGTSTTTVINPSTLLEAKYFQGFKYMCMPTWTSVTSGAGAFGVLAQSNLKNLGAPTSTTGHAYGYVLNNMVSRGVVSNVGADFTKRTIIGGRFCKNVSSTDSNTVFRFIFGKYIPTSYVGDLTARGVGFRQIANGALELQVHNGTGLYNVTSSFTPTVSQAFDVVIIAESGTATLYVNGSSVATSANAPTTTLASNYGTFQVECQNLATITGTASSYACSDFFIQTNT